MGQARVFEHGSGGHVEFVSYLYFFCVDIGYSVGVSCSLEGRGCRATSLPDIEVTWYLRKGNVVVKLMRTVGSATDVGAWNCANHNPQVNHRAHV